MAVIIQTLCPKTDQKNSAYLRSARERGICRLYASIPRLQLLDQLTDRRHETVRIIWIATETIGVVTGEHKVELDIVGMADGLQRLLDAETARIGLLAGRARLVLRPVRKLAG